MHTDGNTNPLGHLRLLQLVSPGLPIGGFTYSQGLEYAVACGWVNNRMTLTDWLTGILDNMTYLDVPILQRSYAAVMSGNHEALEYWSHFLIASRESRELRLEEGNRAKALIRLLRSLNVTPAEAMTEAMNTCQTAPFALAAVTWKIAVYDAAIGYVWSWLENQVTAAVKLIPLGQTHGQQVQFDIAEKIPRAVETGVTVGDEDIGSSAPALGIAGGRHETQYTRLFRS